MCRLILFCFLSLTATPLMAMDRISDRATLMQILNGKTINIGIYALKLNVLPNGTITGKAGGRKVTGSWAWKDGYFCRTMFWGKREIPYNCQLVEWNGRKMRFTTDRGKGDSADFGVR